MPGSRVVTVTTQADGSGSSPAKPGRQPRRAAGRGPCRPRAGFALLRHRGAAHGGGRLRGLAPGRRAGGHGARGNRPPPAAPAATATGTGCAPVRVLPLLRTPMVGIDFPEFNLRVAAGAQVAQEVPDPCPVAGPRRFGPGGRAGCAPSAMPWTSCSAYCRSRPTLACHGVRAEFVGHPLADRIPLESDRAGARAALGLAGPGRMVVVLPGSRRAEVGRLGAPFAATVRLARVAPAGHHVRRRDGERRRAAGVRHQPRDLRAGRRGPRGRRARAGLHGRERRRAARLRHGDARGGAGQAPDGGRLPGRAAHQLAAARLAAGQDRVFLAAKPARRAGRSSPSSTGGGPPRRARARGARAVRTTGPARTRRGLRWHAP